MPRPPRIFVPGGFYHVASRGNNKRALFLYDEDRRAFLRRLGLIVERFELRCLAYCLMGNHYHLIVQTPDSRLSKAVRDLNGAYSRDFNQRHGYVAHLFGNRFAARLIDSESHLLMACRYVAHNPVKAGLCREPSEWPWSSYRASAGIDHLPSFLNDSALGDAFGPGSRWRARYRNFVDLAEVVDPPPGHKELLL
ncbi:MAG: transposase [Gaiellaceae bacterium]